MSKKRSRTVQSSSARRRPSRARAISRAVAAAQERGHIIAEIQRQVETVHNHLDAVVGGTVNTHEVGQSSPTSTPAVTIPIPTITFVHYLNRSYSHVNGQASGSYSPDQAAVAQRTAEALEATGAVRVAEVDLRHLSV